MNREIAYPGPPCPWCRNWEHDEYKEDEEQENKDERRSDIQYDIENEEKR